MSERFVILEQNDEPRLTNAIGGRVFKLERYARAFINAQCYGSRLNPDNYVIVPIGEVLDDAEILKSGRIVCHVIPA